MNKHNEDDCFAPDDFTLEALEHSQGYFDYLVTQFWAEYKEKFPEYYQAIEKCAVEVHKEDMNDNK